MKELNKLRLLIFVLFISALASCQQEASSYKISGNFPEEMIGDTIVLKDYNKQVVAKIAVEGTSVSVTGSIQEATKVRVGTSKRGHGSFILENANYKISLENGRLNFKGGECNDLVYAYRYTDAYKESVKNRQKVLEEAFTGINSQSADEQDVKALEEARRKSGEAYAAVSKIVSDHQITIVEGDYPAYTKLLALEPSTYGVRNFEKYVSVVEEIKKELEEDNAYLKMVEASIARRKSNIAKSKKFAVGRKYTDVSATTIDGKKISLSDVVPNYKFTLIEFWASWCGPCRASFPHLKKVYSKYHDKGFEVFGVSLDTKEKAYLKASKQEDIPWINAVDYNGYKGDAAKAYNVSGIPFTVLIAKDGTIVAAGDNIRDEKLDEKLKELFGE
ncbi:TlpA disulfide reductase family protein [Marinifilum flexuosum]|nr:TlpA disulfide reductase family protein [Marinifilum flexuosum]